MPSFLVLLTNSSNNSLKKTYNIFKETASNPFHWIV